jgi:hypothetical protein
MMYIPDYKNRKGVNYFIIFMIKLISNEKKFSLIPFSVSVFIRIFN